MERRRAQLEKSVARYLAQLDTAELHEPSEELAAKTAHLKEKLVKLESEMQRLAAMERLMLASPDQQISLTDPDSRSMATSGRGSDQNGAINLNRHRSPFFAFRRFDDSICTERAFNRWQRKTAHSLVSLCGVEEQMTRVRTIPADRESFFRTVSDLLGPADVAAAVILNTLMDAKSAGIFWKDRESRFLGCNQKFAEDAGVESPADLVGKTNFDAYPKEQAEAYLADDLEVINTGMPKVGIEEPLLLSTGETAWLETNKAPLRNSAGEIIGLLGSYRDVTDRHNAEDERVRMALELAEARQAASMSMLDALTALPNRRCLQEELNQRVALLGADSQKQFAVIATDLDRFKAINDLHGHAVGDELLKEVARRLSEEAQVEGFVARLGGDEFILVMPFSSDADLTRRLSGLIAKFEAPMVLEEHQLVVGVALGVATAPAHGVDSDILMRHADMALYRAKEHGGRHVVFFQSEMEFNARERALLERDLRLAVENDQIVPYFQPIQDLKTGQVACYEVLARWPHPERGLVPPAQFIQIAADAGLIGALTMNLLRRACHEAKNWPGAPRLALNIAPVQLLDLALPQKLLKLLSACGFPPARLEIEVTEEALVSDITTAKAILTSLKNQGMRIALDDFGTGYSSLKHLSQLPFDTLKIDQSFVRSMNDSDNALVIVKAIVQLAKNLGLGLIAEGIETEQQAIVLGALGCEYGQGYYLGRPLPGIRYAEERSKKDDENEASASVDHAPVVPRVQRRAV